MRIYKASKPLVEYLISCNVLYISLVSCEILLFANANWIFSADHRSISIVAPDANFATILRRHLASGEKYKILVPQRLILDPIPESSLSWSVIITKTRGMRIPQLWFLHADPFLGGPRLPPEVVSAHLTIPTHSQSQDLAVWYFR